MDKRARPNSVWLEKMHLEYKNTKSLKINDRNKMYHKNGIWRLRWLWLISDKIDQERVLPEIKRSDKENKPNINVYVLKNSLKV